MPNFTFYEGREQKATIFFFFFWTSIQSIKIELQKKMQKLKKFDELKEIE